MRPVQASWLPVVCTRVRPAPRTAAADFIGIDERSTHRWLCKGQGRHPLVPATEWICSHLAAACALPVPPAAVVERADQPGVPYFGSQWQGGAVGFVEAMGRISNAEVFARTHAADLVVHNTDRHRDNFLYLELAGEIVARVIDFSHALLVAGWPLPALPMAECNTTRELPLLLAEDARPYVRPMALLERMGALPDDWMHQTMEPMPAAWLPAAEREPLCQWWSGRARRQRLADAQSCLP